MQLCSNTWMPLTKPDRVYKLKTHQSMGVEEKSNPYVVPTHIRIYTQHLLLL